MQYWVTIAVWLSLSYLTLVTRMSLTPTTMSHSPSPHNTVATVSLKLPTFWPANPELWFAQVDAQFRTKRITSQATKFKHVIATLAPQYDAEVRDLILKPPDTDPYDRLKEELIKHTTASEQWCLQLLFNAEDLGDRTPSDVYSNYLAIKLLLPISPFFVSYFFNACLLMYVWF